MAFKTDEKTFCGELVYILEDNSGMLALDRDLEKLKVTPGDNPAGTYSEAFLKFYFID